MKTNCSYCNIEIDRKPSVIKRSKNNYCSKECTDNARKIKIELKCDTCGKDITKRPSEIKDNRGNYCSKSCAATSNNKYKIRNWTDGSKSYSVRAKREYGKKCNMCGYDKYPEILEVHHIDEDRSNNNINNLEVLCPNCHKIKHFVKI